jgi:hypothetical protein
MVDPRIPIATVLEKVVDGETTWVKLQLNSTENLPTGEAYLYRNGIGTRGELGLVDATTLEAVLRCDAEYEASVPLAIGEVAAVVDAWWEPYALNLIENAKSEWIATEFRPSDAWVTIHPNGGRALMKPRPGDKKNSNQTIVQGGWDHEHCAVCHAHISMYENQHAYRNAEDDWICGDCYEKYGELKSIALVLPGSGSWG